MKAGLSGGGGEGKVQLRGAAAEEGGGFEVEAGVLAGLGGDVVGAGFVEEGRWGAGVCGRWDGGDGFVVAGELVEGVLPAVALVFDEALEHGEGGLVGGRRVGSRLPRAGPRISPRKGAMRGKWATSVRKRPISVSGFSPGWRRRKSFRMSFWLP